MSRRRTRISPAEQLSELHKRELDKKKRESEIKAKRKLKEKNQSAGEEENL